MDSASVQAELSFFSRLKEATAVGRNEIRDASTMQKAAVGAAVLAVAYEWSPFNEYVAGATSADIFDAGRGTGDTMGAVMNSLETGISAGMITGATQMAVGVLAALAVRSMPNSMSTLSGANQNTHPISNKPGVLTTLALGTSAAVIEKNYENPTRKFKDDIKLVGAASAIVMGANLLLGTAVGGAVSALDSANHNGASDIIIDQVKNPLWYIVIFAGAKFKNHQKAKRKLASIK